MKLYVNYQERKENIMKCPNCNSELINYECIDTEWEGNTYYDTVTAVCSKCNKVYIWTDVYKLHESIDFRELKEGE